MNFVILVLLASSLVLIFKGVQVVLRLERESSYEIGFSKGYSKGVDHATDAADYYSQRSVRKAL